MAPEAYGYYGNVLPKYVPETVEKPSVEVKKEKKSKVRIRVTPKFYARVYAGLVLVAIFTIVFRFAVINEMARSNELMNTQLADLRATNEQHSIQLDMATDLKLVEEIAHNELNMGVPQAYQTVEVSVGMENKAVKVEKSDNGFVSMLKKMSSNVMEYLY